MTQPKTSQELYALIEEATLHLALLRCQEAELAALPQAEAPQAPPPASLRRAYASRRARQALRTWGPRTLRAAAAVLLVFYLGLTTALATVPSLRHSLMTFMIHSEEEYTELALIPSGETLDIPQGWQGAYYPAYIPEGFAITHVAPRTPISFGRMNREGIYGLMNSPPTIPPILILKMQKSNLSPLMAAPPCSAIKSAY